MGYPAPLGRVAAFRFAVALAIGLLGAVLLFASAGEPASAAPLVGKDGKIHACYKVKGKAKGTLRVVRNAKVRCPRRWKKVAWNATGSAAAPAENGTAGQPGGTGGTGLPGTTPNVADLESKITELQTKVTELLGKVGSLESVLKGISNEQLLKAVAAVPVVESLCTQTKKLNEQTTALGVSTAALNTILDTLVPLFVPVTVPTALASFTCPSF
jgi:hypothetical protein